MADDFFVIFSSVCTHDQLVVTSKNTLHTLVFLERTDKPKFPPAFLYQILVLHNSSLDYFPYFV